MKIKQCQKCGKDKQTSDFLPNENTLDGLTKECMACKAEAKGMTEDDYFWNYLTKVGTARLNRREPAYREKELKYATQWRKNNPEKPLAYAKTYKDRNPVIVRSNARRSTAKRRQHILEFTINDLTEHDWKSIKEHYNNSCAYCGCAECEITMDHVLPVSRGGQHTKDNIVPACRPCNSKKHAKTPKEAGMEILNH